MSITINESWYIKALTLVGALALTSNVLAQTPPDAGDLMREAEPPKTLDSNVIPDLPESPQPPTELEGVSLPVAKFNINGNTLVSEEALQQVVQPWLGKQLTLAELKHVTDLIAETYRSEGYLVRAYLPEQNIHDGSVLIEIIEARLGEVKIESDTDRLSNNPELLNGLFLSRQQPGEFFNLTDIERASLLSNDVPGIRTKTVLAASEEQGHTDIKLSVEETERVSSYLSYDDYGSESSGESRLIYSAALNSPFQRGDLVSLNGMISEGNLYARVGYEAPVGFDGWRVGASLSLLDYELGGAFSALDAEGDATTLSLTSSYPLVRQLRGNLRLNGSLSLREYSNEQLGIETSDKSVTALNVGVTGDRLDQYKGGGVLYYGINLTLGDLDLSGNATNLLLDQSSARTNGSYNKVAWNLARLQRINEKTNLWLGLNGQFVNKNVDSSETMSLGGMNGVRAYPTLEASGDEGYLMVAEVRHSFRQNWVLKGFVDVGRITSKATQNEAKASHTLKGYGVAADWVYPQEKLTARITVARRIGDNPLRDPVTGNDSDGTRDLYPVWINVVKHF
jgi:hemolysin activation/secretion protein